MKYNFHIYLLGNLMFGFCQWVTIILLVKYSNTTLLGHYTYGIAIVAPLILLLSFGLNTLIVTNNKFKHNIYFYTRCISSLLIIIIYMFIVVKWTNLNTDVYLLMAFIAFTKVIENVNDIKFAYWISENNHRKVGIFKFVLSIYQISLTTFFVIIYHSLITALIIYSVTLFFYTVISNRKYLKINIKEFNNIIVLCMMGVPISITLFLSSLNSNIPKYLLEIYSNIESVGIFSGLLTIYSIGNTFLFSIYNYLLPTIVKNKNDFIFLKKVLLYIILISTFTSSIIITLSFLYFDNIINIILSNKFAKFNKEFILLIISSCLIYVSILFDLFINSHKKYKYNTVVQIISVLTILISSLIAIPKFDIYGAMMSFSIFAVIVFSMKLILSIKIIKKVKNSG
ncbi:lipopolysaccharide biosynthesis protein [Mammaliicoccus sciuri]|uniref:lipopolysaccharide biosynthesis protein n=1 Tax=Mammaliicoccus sciuri TaxID=1296 RepID=UPI002888BE22|nr:hypothetical protein [Mammaliicoccus sciuri]MDT0695301.1 hypothetical protein [Mammaliicoccus sciuri]